MYWNVLTPIPEIYWYPFYFYSTYESLPEQGKEELDERDRNTRISFDAFIHN